MMTEGKTMKSLGNQALGNGNEHFGVHDRNGFCPQRGCITPPCQDGCFPCALSCPLCREALRCNECGMTALDSERCTNGRCENCCPQVCKHVTA